jgi:hypothetical protein
MSSHFNVAQNHVYELTTDLMKISQSPNRPNWKHGNRNYAHDEINIRFKFGECRMQFSSASYLPTSVGQQLWV